MQTNTTRMNYHKNRETKKKEMNMNKTRIVVCNSLPLILLHIDKFKTHRRILFAIGKAIKYTLWLSFAIFWYHMYLLKKTPKPE